MEPVPLTFKPGIYSNRSSRASRGRYVDGNLVRFRDDVPGQIGGWLTPPYVGAAIAGVPRGIIAWRPNSQTQRFFSVGTHSNAYQCDGSLVSDITPVPFTAGRVDSIYGSGYGTSTYSLSSYGSARTGGSSVLDASTWTFDTFGETVLGMFSGDGILYEYTAGTDPRFVAVTGAPTGRAMLVSAERHVFILGTNNYPNRVDWSDRENRNDWTPSSINRAGFYELQTASALQCGKRCRGQVIIWSQTDVFALAPLSSSLVYSRQTLATDSGAAGPQAVAVVTTDSGEMAFWVGTSNFYAYDGQVRVIPCDLYDYVFKDMNRLQRAKFYAGVNQEFSEVWFFYVSESADEIDRAVIYNYQNATWSKANISRTVWLSKGIFSFPLALTAAGVIYEHEQGDTDAGAAMNSYITSAPLDSGGMNYLDIGAFWPDMEPGGAQATVTLIGRAFPGAPDETYGPYLFDASMEKVDLTISVRQVQVKISGYDGHWEIGTPMLEIQPAGER